MEDNEKKSPDGPSGEMPRQGDLSDRHFDFLREVYDTHQTLIRQLDTKAGVMVGILTLLLVGLLPLAKGVPSKLHLSGCGAVTSWGFVISAVIFISGFLVTTWLAQMVILPRHGTTGADLGLMYGIQILRYKDKNEYYRALISVRPSDLLEHMADNIFQLSTIESEKIKSLSQAHWPILISLVAWSVNAVLIIYVSTWS